MENRPDPLDMGRAYRLALTSQPRGGVAGRQFGRGTGNSLEFQEIRDYQPGDDLRHVDWRSYARTETLHSRLYRDEISPTAELILDTSRSMTLTPAKAAATRWAARFMAAVLAPDMHLRGVLSDDRPRLVARDALLHPDLPGVRWDGSRSLADASLTGLLRQGALRVVISDFLFPHDPEVLVDRVGRGASTLLFVAILDPDELDPPQRGSLRLHEVETGARAELPVDDRCVARYRDRLQRLWDGLAAAARRRASVAVRWNAARPAHEWISEELVRRGVVEPR